MEFPTLGEHCQEEGCNQTDFLPLQCECGKVFCRFHFNNHCLSGNCKSATKPKELKSKSEDQIFRCSQPDCRKGNLHEMLCPKCMRHYCVEHRFHESCPEIDEETLALKREQIEVPKRQFNEVNKHLQEKITENIRKALQSSAKVKTATKIHLMRIKQKATGPKSVPVTRRVYFAITKPTNCEPKLVRVAHNENSLASIDVLYNATLDPNLKNCVPVFVSSEWTLGRAFDSICETCNIFNENNKIGTCKARLFRQLDGYCVSPVKMEVQIAELMKQEILLEGDRLIVEYVSEDILRDLNEESQVFLDATLRTNL